MFVKLNINIGRVILKYMTLILDYLHDDDVKYRNVGSSKER